MTKFCAAAVAVLVAIALLSSCSSPRQQVSDPSETQAQAEALAKALDARAKERAAARRDKANRLTCHAYFNWVTDSGSRTVDLSDSTAHTTLLATLAKHGDKLLAMTTQWLKDDVQFAATVPEARDSALKDYRAIYDLCTERGLS